MADTQPHGRRGDALVPRRPTDNSICLRTTCLTISPALVRVVVAEHRQRSAGLSPAAASVP
eukprot:CAMPEP_0172567576 /NCGR_PEP_ID=MMETSP1067-20121228/116365_1 /TAXON_ID=265564 ORGANISM="Thalassiosira punctigera, Strain Tpunct2005C2" /NCGR_SAMPLE_ID=MMETSP1067 /ASSEMBLY_ACC=CAM_ASM_000444 /LENGTH=60 /DNA_ID=CAMNT_0013358955 /DNA_START=14 /DNA_END=193 /DNA_ORIENTATION=+